MNITLYPFNNKFIIDNEKLIGKGRSSIINKFIYNDKEYIIKYFNNEYQNNNFKEFTYLNNIFNNNLSYICYGYNHRLINIDNKIYNSISIYDYIKGYNLTNYLLHNNFDLLIYYNIINYIDNLHKKYILHNDLILDNIIITKNNLPKKYDIHIIDYGECICFYKNIYLSEYYINDDIINNMTKNILNDYIINYEGYKINYNDNLIITNLTDACKEYIKHIKSIDKYNVYHTLILQKYYKDKKIKYETRIKKVKRLFYYIFDTIDNIKYMNEILFQYLITYNFSKRLNIPLYTLILFKYNKLTQKTLQQLFNIYNCIINNINIILIFKDLQILNENNINTIYTLKKYNIKKLSDILNYIEYNKYDNLNKLSDIDILILCIIHYSLSIYYIDIPSNILLHFTYPYISKEDYINNLSIIKLVKQKNINFDLNLINNLLLI